MSIDNTPEVAVGNRCSKKSFIQTAAKVAVHFCDEEFSTTEVQYGSPEMITQFTAEEILAIAADPTLCDFYCKGSQTGCHKAEILLNLLVQLWPNHHDLLE